MKTRFTFHKNKKNALSKAHRAEREQGAGISSQPKTHMAPKTDFEPADQTTQEVKGSKLTRAAKKVFYIVNAGVGKVMDILFVVVEFFIFVYVIYHEEW